MKKLLKIIKNAIKMNITNSNSNIALGQSKIGGKPHLPKDFEWPYFLGTNLDNETKNRPLSFICQINLEEVKQFDAENLLPNKGMLYFFYDLDTMPWGFEPKDKGSVKVIYKNVSVSELSEINYPDDLSDKFFVPQQYISFNSEQNLPFFEEYSDIINPKADWDEYDEKVAKLNIDHNVEPDQQFKLLGYADLIQNSILEECEMVSRGIDCGGAVEIPKKIMKEIKKNTSDWILLAQFGTISEDIMFGDCGCIYFYIRKQDLAILNFDNIHFSLQCY